jgi:hypothetical protein
MAVLSQSRRRRVAFMHGSGLIAVTLLTCPIRRSGGSVGKQGKTVAKQLPSLLPFAINAG